MTLRPAIRIIFTAYVASCLTLGLPTQEPRRPVTEAPLDEVAMEDTQAESVAEDYMETGGEPGDGDEASYEDDPSPQGQHLFPSFSSLFPPLGHSRPFFAEVPTPAPSRASYGGDGFHRVHISRSLGYDDSESVLGSGNFGVIRGGTYYGGGGSADEAYTRSGNSHGRPYRRPNPEPQFRNGGDFFSGFRDFADITTPTKSAYSEIYVVYANRNSTAGSSRPKNIRELIDGDELTEDEEKEAKSKTKKKLRLHKEKTAAIEASKKLKFNSRPKDVEPLLALS